LILNQEKITDVSIQWPSILLSESDRFWWLAFEEYRRTPWWHFLRRAWLRGRMRALNDLDALVGQIRSGDLPRGSFRIIRQPRPCVFD